MCKPLISANSHSQTDKVSVCVRNRWSSTVINKPRILEIITSAGLVVLSQSLNFIQTIKFNIVSYHNVSRGSVLSQKNGKRFGDGNYDLCVSIMREDRLTRNWSHNYKITYSRKRNASEPVWESSGAEVLFIVKVTQWNLSVLLIVQHKKEVLIAH